MALANAFKHDGDMIDHWLAHHSEARIRGMACGQLRHVGGKTGQENGGLARSSPLRLPDQQYAAQAPSMHSLDAKGRIVVGSGWKD
jgi:hypothetical protein